MIAVFGIVVAFVVVVAVIVLVVAVAVTVLVVGLVVASSAGDVPLVSPGAIFLFSFDPRLDQFAQFS